VYYAGPAKTPEGHASGSFGPTTAGRMDGYVDLFQSHGGSMVMLAKGNRSPQVTEACQKHGGFYLGSAGGPAALLATDHIKSLEVLEYPELGMEAIWKIEVENFPAFILVDNKGNDFFPPTTFQITKIEAGTGSNVIPGECLVHFNFRYCTENTAESLEERVVTILEQHKLKYDLQWHLSGRPFLTDSGALVSAAQNAIRTVTGEETELSTSGGTSDGRFIAPTGAQVLELGPLNATIHKVNECVKAADLNTLSAMYEQILVELLA
jgi:tartrate/fumarate subfamily iron-sulfur-dependent hydro-lyase beta chain